MSPKHLDELNEEELGKLFPVFLCDYLIAHPETASEYEKLKIQLARRFPNHIESYTNAKTEFIERIMKELKKPLD